MRKFFTIMIIFVLICIISIITASKNTEAGTTGYAYDCYFPGQCTEGDRVVATAAQHKNQVYGRGGAGYNSAGKQDLRVPIDCRGLVGVVFRETNHSPGLLSTVKAYQDWYRNNTFEFTTWDDLNDYNLALIDRLIQDSLGPGDLIIFGAFNGKEGTHIGIYDGYGNVWNAESGTDTKYARNAPYDGSRPGVQCDPYQGFGTRDKNGNPVSGIFPTMVIRTGFHDSPPKSNTLPEAPDGYGPYSSPFDFSGDRRADMLTLRNGVMSLSLSTGFDIAAPLVMQKGPSLAKMRIVFSPGAFDTGDSYADLLAVNDTDNGSELLLYKGGQNGFLAPVRIGENVDWSSMDGVFSPGHFSGGPSQPDIFSRDKDGRLWVYQKGDFTNPRQLMGTTWNSSSMKWVFSPGDWDRDGDADIIAIDNVGDMWLYDGPDFIRGTERIGGGWGGMNFVFSPGDFDGDGKPDVIARKASNGDLMLYKGTGLKGTPGSANGAFSGVIQIGWKWNTMTSIFSPGNFGGTGSADVLAVNDQGMLLFYEGRQTYFIAGKPVNMPGADFTGTTAFLSPGDLDDGDPDGDGIFSRDGHPDVIAVKDGRLWLYSGKGMTLSENSRPVGESTNWGSMKWILSPGDFDEDLFGLPDIIAINDAGDLFLYPGELAANGRYDLGSEIKIGGGWKIMKWVFSGGDYSGDGYPDIVAVVGDSGRSDYGQLLLYKNNKSGRLENPVKIGTGWQNFNYVFSPGDLEPDGLADVIARDNDGKLFLYVPTPLYGKWSSQRLPIGTGINYWSEVLFNN